MRTLLAAAAIAASAAALPASAQSFTLVPPQPNEFDPVVLRMTVDACVFDIDRIGVRNDLGVIRVLTAQNACFAPGPTRVIDVRLGSLPIGNYRLEVVGLQGDIAGTLAGFAFNVTPRPTIAIFPPPKRPLTDYSGNWAAPGENGWGLSIQHSPSNTLFAQLFVYGANGAPAWFTFQGGQWKSATRWEGTVFASTGPGFALPTYDPRQFVIQPVGPATLEFQQEPGTVGLATLTYAVGSATVTKRIRRLAF